MVSLCINKLKIKILNIIDDLELNEKQKKKIHKRYLSELLLYNHKGKVTEIFYIFLSIFVTIATIILPALLSIQQIDYSDDKHEDDAFKKKIYWSTWVISLSGTISNGLVQFLNLNTQFVTYNQTKEKLMSEGWHYFQLSGKYRGKNHQECYIDFCEEIENIKRLQVEKELMFISVSESSDSNENKKEGNVSLEIRDDKRFSKV